MNKRILRIILLFVLLVGFVGKTSAAAAQEDDPIVRFVLLFSPNCSHCTYVREEIFPPLFEQYGDQLQIAYIDTTTAEEALFKALVLYYELPPEKQGVPLLIIGETVLIGSYEIPEYLPGLIEEGILSGGIDWPSFPILEKYLPTPVPTVEITQTPLADNPSPMPAATETELPLDTITPTITAPTPTPAGSRVIDTLRRDLVGNTVSVVVLLGMLIILVGAGFQIGRPAPDRKSWPEWVIPVLSVLGLVVAGYLSFIEVTDTRAVCGPVGDCNTVQQSPYATLFGFLPVGILGLLGYGAILGLWMVQFWVDSLKGISRLGLWIISLIGLLFSIYLTFLEPFVIGATCAWCLSSAVIMTGIFWSSTIKMN
ncbi:MAG: vitamin K epoxide reductase family protein [Anaerolineales bacterium]